MDTKTSTQLTDASITLTSVGWAFGIINTLSNNFNGRSDIASIITLVAFFMQAAALAFACASHKRTDKKVLNIIAIVSSSVYLALVLIGICFLFIFIGKIR